MALRPPKQGVLGFFGRRELPHVGGNVLGEELRELAELEQGAVWILGEVALREHTEAHERVVVLGKLREVG